MGRRSRAAHEWQDNDRQPDYLFRGLQLSQAESRIEEYKSWGLSAQQEEFLTASQESAALEALEEEKIEEVGRQDARRTTNFAVAGGAVGLGLSAVLVNLVTEDLAGIFALFFISGAVVTGAFVGLVYVPVFDMIVSASRQRNEMLSWPAAILAGIIAFLLAALLFFFLLSENMIVLLLAGIFWGTAAGVGRLWIQRSERPRLVTVPLVAVGICAHHRPGQWLVAD